jgi:hypothetical protein
LREQRRNVGCNVSAMLGIRGWFARDDRDAQRRIVWLAGNMEPWAIGAGCVMCMERRQILNFLLADLQPKERQLLLLRESAD